MNEVQQAICTAYKVPFQIGKVQLRCIYPGHNDSNPSAAFFFSQKGGWYHCQGCHVSKSIWQVAKDLGIKYTYSGKMPTRYEDEIDYSSFEEESPKLELKRSLNPMELLEQFYYDKGITPRTINDLGGYVSDEGYLVLSYSWGRRRVGRNLGEITKSAPRFLNSKGGDKGLLNEECLKDFDEVFLVEGFTDFLALWQAGCRNVVCSFGSELSEEQAYLLRHKTVFVLFDKDYAGWKGAIQTRDRLKEHQAIPIILELAVPESFDWSKKLDVNYACHHHLDWFKDWLRQATEKYSTFDDEYVDSYLDKPPLRYYQTDIGMLELTNGLYVFTGPPGVGKTTLGVSLVDKLVQQGARVLYCNYDLPRDQIIARIASRQSNHTWKEIERSHNVLEARSREWLKMTLRNVKVMNKLTIDEIRHAMKHYDACVIDYLQRIRWYGSDPRVGLEANLEILSDLAVDDTEGKVVAAISRMPASAYGRSEGHLFSGSAAIEYHAQAGILLQQNKNDRGKTIVCDVFKNTRGETGQTIYKVNYPHQIIEETRYNDIEFDRMIGQWDEAEPKRKMRLVK